MISICIAFRNEGEQIFKTVESINRSVDEDLEPIEIIVINDKSDDGFDYGPLNYYENVVYYRNKERLGSSQTKEKAIQLASSDTIALFDSHMRFKPGWYSTVINNLDINSERIYTLYTVGLNPDTEEWIHHNHNGAVIQYAPDKIMQAAWTSFDLDPDSNISKISTILGASYFFSKQYFNRLKGFKGLRLYGREEEYISIKSWGLGDGCYLVKDCQVAHLYRKKAPQPITRKEVWYNILTIAYTLLPEELCISIESTMKDRDIKTYSKVQSELDFNFLKDLRQQYIREGFDYDKFSRVNNAVLNKQLLK